jgi:conjugal transfer pilus assembly protein TraW
MRFTSSRTYVAALALAVAWSAASGENLGRIGNTYPVTEMDARQFLEAELAKQSKSGTALQDSSRKAAAAFLAELPPIEGIGRADRNRTRYVDTTLVLERDVADENGSVLVRAGTRIDPMQRAELDGVLFILDGRDPLQVSMLQRLWRSNVTAHPILVGGSHTGLSERFQRPFYYDYGGAISTRFGITKVPAIVGQDGSRIRVEEVKP